MFRYISIILFKIEYYISFRYIIDTYLRKDNKSITVISKCT